MVILLGISVYNFNVFVRFWYQVKFMHIDFFSIYINWAERFLKPQVMILELSL